MAKERSGYQAKQPVSSVGTIRRTVQYPKEQLAIIEQARKLTGYSLSYFVVQAAHEKAQAILEAHKIHPGDDLLVTMDRVTTALKAYRIAFGSTPQLPETPKSE